ncbi:MAG: DUF6429 family protein [Endomicrobia bacterium]|nr:DUF6429 family protein [Endomicrobiia bacterium]
MTAWEEGIEQVGKYLANWKTYRFEILDVLTEKGYINNNKRHKSISITKTGEEKAKELAKKYGIKDHS